MFFLFVIWCHHDHQAPDKTISLYHLVRFAWRYKWPEIVTIVVAPYILLAYIGLMYLRRRSQDARLDRNFAYRRNV
jgi:hypothetical protein